MVEVSKEYDKLGEAALRDLREYYSEAVKPLVPELVKRYRAAAEVEKKILELRDEALEKCARVTHYPRIVFPYIPTPLLRSRDERCFYSLLENVLRLLREEGFSV